MSGSACFHSFLSHSEINDIVPLPPPHQEMSEDERESSKGGGERDVTFDTHISTSLLMPVSACFQSSLPHNEIKDQQLLPT